MARRGRGRKRKRSAESRIIEAVETVVDGKGGGSTLKTILILLTAFAGIGGVTAGGSFLGTSQVAPGPERMDSFEKRLENMETGQGKQTEILSEINANLKAGAVKDAFREKVTSDNSAKIELLGKEVTALSEKFTLKREFEEWKERVRKLEQERK